MYNALEELMSYFHFEFNVYLVLALIVCINCINEVLHYRALKRNEIEAIPNTFNLIASLVVGVGLFNALLFQGVISDIYGGLWFNKVFIVCIVACAAFIIQCVFCAKIASMTKSETN